MNLETASHVCASGTCHKASPYYTHELLKKKKKKVRQEAQVRQEALVLKGRAQEKLIFC